MVIFGKGLIFSVIPNLYNMFYVVAAPFAIHMKPNDVQDIYLICALDSCTRTRQSQKPAEKPDTFDNDELKELQS